MEDPSRPSSTEPDLSCFPPLERTHDDVSGAFACVEGTGPSDGWPAGGKEPSAEPEGAFVPLDDWDCRVLASSDLASCLLEELHTQTGELPVLDQSSLDRVFLAPPRPDVATPLPVRRHSGGAGGPHSWRGDAHSAKGGCSSRKTPGIPSRSPRSSHFLTADSNLFPKMSSHHYLPSSVSASGVLIHHHPSSSSSTPLPLRLGSAHGNSSPVSSSCSRRKESPMDMHSYSVSMDNLIRCSVHPPHAPANRCLNTHSLKSFPSSTSPSSSSPLSHHGPHGPLVSCSSPHSQPRFQPHNVSSSSSSVGGAASSSCGTLQHRFSPHVYASNPRGNSPALIDHPLSSSPKQSPHHHHMYPIRCPSGGGGSSGPRLYPSSIGLNSPGPLITSLSPLRGPSKAGCGPMKRLESRIKLW
ncbi:putative protein TPRXL [Aplysia californica]|uniref:Uncharacterized protein n=1 Tax=Aplysia californica TaxID=6500 RepID=A0ABM1A183_APLCA|nr:putative protein TPRXL [Aplysia californica]